MRCYCLLLPPAVSLPQLEVKSLLDRLPSPAQLQVMARSFFVAVLAAVLATVTAFVHNGEFACSRSISKSQQAPPAR